MVAIEHDALKRFVKATEEFEARFGGSIIGLSGPRTQFGELYSEYLNGKSRIEGETVGEAFASPDDAITATFARLCESHPSDPALTLHWRIKPEIDYSDVRKIRKGYITYCRFALSDKATSVTNG